MGHEADATFEPSPSSVARARSFVRTTLSGWGIGQLSDATTLLVSELATNAVVHARTAFRLHVEFDDPRLTVEVHDGSIVLPRRDDAGPDDARGRGLRIVDGLAATWGHRRDDDGKTVWFTLDCTT